MHKKGNQRLDNMSTNEAPQRAITASPYVPENAGLMEMVDVSPDGTGFDHLEEVAREAAESADRHSEERASVRGSAQKAQTERDEAAVAQAQQERDGRIFEDAYERADVQARHDHPDASDAEIDAIATRSARAHLGADREWNRVYAEKMQEFKNVGDPSDKEDMFAAAAADAADEAKARYLRAHGPRADAISDVAGGVARGRAAVAEQRAEEAAQAERLEAVRAEMEGRTPKDKAYADNLDAKEAGGVGGPNDPDGPTRATAIAGQGADGHGRGRRGGEGDLPPQQPEVKLTPEMKDLANRIAELKQQLEENVRGDGVKKELDEAVKEMGDRLDLLAEEFGIPRTTLSALVNEQITRRRIELAPPEIQGKVARFGDRLNKITRGIANFVKKNKWTKIGTAVVVGGVVVAGLTGIGLGVAAGAGLTILVTGAKGAVAGAITGTLRGIVTQKGRLAATNVREAVHGRYRNEEGGTRQNEDGWASATHQFREEQRREIKKGVRRSGRIGAAAGFLAAAGLAGWAARHAYNAFSDTGTGTEGSPVTGQEGVPTNPDVQAPDISEVAKGYQGRWAWDSYVHGLQKQGIVMNDGKALRGILDGAHATQTASHNVAGLKFGTWGQIDPTSLHPTGRTWGFNIKVTNHNGFDVVAPKAPNPHTAPDGGEVLMQLKPGHSLTGSEQAALFDALNHGAKLVVSPEHATSAATGNNFAQAIAAGAKAGAGDKVSQAILAGAKAGVGETSNDLAREAANAAADGWVAPGLIGGAAGLVAPRPGYARNLEVGPTREQVRINMVNELADGYNRLNDPTVGKAFIRGFGNNKGNYTALHRMNGRQYDAFLKQVADRTRLSVDELEGLLAETAPKTKKTKKGEK